MTCADGTSQGLTLLPYSGIIARPLNLPDASRRISLVFRPSFPRRAALDAFAGVIRDRLPNIVRAQPIPSA